MEGIILVREIFMEKDLTKTDLKVYAALCDFMSFETATCFPSYKTIAKKAGCSRVAAINSIKKLTEKGYLEKTARFSDEGDRTSNKYTLTFELKRILEYRKKKNKTVKSEEIKTEKIKPEEVKAEIKPEEVKTEIKPEEVKTEIKPEEVKTEIKPEEVKTEIKPEEVKAEIKPEEIKTEEEEQDELKKDEELEKINRVRGFITEPLVDNEIKTLLKVSNASVEKIKEKYEIAKSQSCNNLVGFLIRAIKDNYQPNISIQIKKNQTKKKNKFVNYTEREVDVEKIKEVERRGLEKKLKEIDERRGNPSTNRPLKKVYNKENIYNALTDYSIYSCPGSSMDAPDFSYSDLSGLDLLCHYLSGINCEGSDLSKTQMQASEFIKASFKNANLSGADVEKANFSGADFTGADLTGIKHYKDANFDGANFTEVKADSEFLEYIESEKNKAK